MFDQELIAQVVAAGMRGRIGEIAVPTRYFEEASSVGFKRSVVYGLSTLRVVGPLPPAPVARSAFAAAHRAPTRSLNPRHSIVAMAIRMRAEPPARRVRSGLIGLVVSIAASRSVVDQVDSLATATILGRPRWAGSR